MRQLPASKGRSCQNTETEESTVLGAVTKQQLVKTGWEELMHAIVSCNMHDLVIVL
jgi:hypothetical protein